MLNRRNRYEQAIEDFDKMIELDPKDAMAYRVRGLAKQALGDTEGAEADFETVKRLSGKDSPE